ncbi:MAG: phenylalanine--tRNA ligase subunit alpha [Clostridia bacterium]|nr:phenylalanine--tRNA ligase subunit alpha [Clostridia bacterium]
MQEKLRTMLENALTELRNAASEKDTEEIRIRFLGKKGEITEVMKSMGKLSPEERKELGRAANEVKDQIQESLKAKAEEIKRKAREGRLRAERIDVTEPGVPVEYGVKHPITQVIEEITDIFSSLGYSVYEGPDIDTVFNTFDGLNSPPTHPARDMTDTFYVTPDIVLRPHTSSAEIRAEQGLPVPYKIVIPGRCYRCDTPDATHSHTFHQIEMMVIGEDITMADLKGTLDLMAKKLFGPETRTKFRPHHFPFTEPSAEMDVSCFKCGGKGCNVCKGSGWIEILGCGMTHPHVHQAGGIDTDKYTGFAVGMGVERIAMLKYGIDDIRNLFENDMRFIKQFK